MRITTLRVAAVLTVLLGLSSGVASGQRSTRRSVLPDLQPPEIVLQAPTLAENFGFMVTAVVRDPSGVSKVFLSVDGEIIHVAWDFGDGTYVAGGPSSDNVYSHTFTVAGSYTITLYVIDNDGSMARAQSTVVVL